MPNCPMLFDKAKPDGGSGFDMECVRVVLRKKSVITEVSGDAPSQRKE